MFEEGKLLMFHLVSQSGGDPGNMEDILVTFEYVARSPIWTATFT